jgi:hypothetical protein
MLGRALEAKHTARLWSWKVFSACGGRVISHLVCTIVDAIASRSLGTPTLVTPSGITKLWSRRYHQIPHLYSERWQLVDGTRIESTSLVFETHLSTKELRRARRAGLTPSQIERIETMALVPLLKDRPGTALVGRTILRRRLSSMGWSVRETPPGLYRCCDTFFRKLYLLAARGSTRAARDEGPVAEVAISVRDFIARGQALIAVDRK